MELLTSQVHPLFTWANQAAAFQTICVVASVTFESYWWQGHHLLILHMLDFGLEKHFLNYNINFPNMTLVVLLDVNAVTNILISLLLRICMQVYYQAISIIFSNSSYWYQQNPLSTRRIIIQNI